MHIITAAGTGKIQNLAGKVKPFHKPTLQRRRMNLFQGNSSAHRHSLAHRTRPVNGQRQSRQIVKQGVALNRRKIARFHLITLGKIADHIRHGADNMPRKVRTDQLPAVLASPAFKFQSPVLPVPFRADTEKQFRVTVFSTDRGGVSGKVKRGKTGKPS